MSSDTSNQDEHKQNSNQSLKPVLSLVENRSTEQCNDQQSSDSVQQEVAGIYRANGISPAEEKSFGPDQESNVISLFTGETCVNTQCLSLIHI